MTDNEEVPGGGLAGWNLTHIPGIICGAGARLGLLAQLSRPQLKHLTDSLAAEQLLCGKKHWWRLLMWALNLNLSEMLHSFKHHHLNKQQLSDCIFLFLSFYQFDVLVKDFLQAEERDGHLKEPSVLLVTFYKAHHKNALRPPPVVVILNH